MCIEAGLHYLPVYTGGSRAVRVRHVGGLQCSYCEGGSESRMLGCTNKTNHLIFSAFEIDSHNFQQSKTYGSDRSVQFHRINRLFYDSFNREDFYLYSKKLMMFVCLFAQVVDARVTSDLFYKMFCPQRSSKEISFT